MQVIITTELTEEWSEDPDVTDLVDVLNIRLEVSADGKTTVHTGQIPHPTKKSVQEWFFKQGVPVPMWVSDRVDFEAYFFSEKHYLYDTETDSLWRKV